MSPVPASERACGARLTLPLPDESGEVHLVTVGCDLSQHSGSHRTDLHVTVTGPWCVTVEWWPENHGQPVPAAVSPNPALLSERP